MEFKQREKKFRAWDPEHWDEVKEEFIGEMFYFDILNLRDDHEGIWYKDNYIGHLLNKDSSIMQYTGLKDKNGKEIYEGDIVDGGFIVAWHLNRWVYSYDGNASEGNLDDDCEVIGNIFENPKLLDEKV